jgi:hypothetical protein
MSRRTNIPGGILFETKSPFFYLIIEGATCVRKEILFTQAE